MNYLINSVLTYKVPNEAEVLSLRQKLANNPYGTLNSFSYKEKLVKEKKEVVDSYYLVSAKIELNSEKEPESAVDVKFGYPEDNE